MKVVYLLDKNSNKELDNEYDEYLNLLNEAHYSNNDGVNKEAYRSLVEMGVIKNSSLNKYKFINYFIYACLLLSGLFNISTFFLHIFGFIFLVASLLACSNSTDGDKGGYIVLFTHGCTGLGVMTGFLISSHMQDPIFSDSFAAKYVYLALCILPMVSGIILTFLRGFSYRIKSNDIFIYLPNLLILIGVLFVELFEYIKPFIIKL